MIHASTRHDPAISVYTFDDMLREIRKFLLHNKIRLNESTHEDLLFQRAQATATKILDSRDLPGILHARANSVEVVMHSESAVIRYIFNGFLLSPGCVDYSNTWTQNFVSGSFCLVPEDSDP
jgi:hypothetical protein